MQFSCLAEVVEKNTIVNAAGDPEADIIIFEGVVSDDDGETVGDIYAVGCIFKCVIGDP